MKGLIAKNNPSEGKRCQPQITPSPWAESHTGPLGDISWKASRGLIRVDERRRFGARILLVENDTALRQSQYETLTAAEFNVVVASSRLEGLAILDQAPGIELIICAYSLGDKDLMGGIVLADKLQNMWTEPRPDRLPSVLLTGNPKKLEQELVAEEHGAYFNSKTPGRDIEILRKADLILLKRRRMEQQEVFLIEHLGRTPMTTYCMDTELISAIYAVHRTKRLPLCSALRERLTFDMLARHSNRWLSLKDLTDLLGRSEFHSRQNQRDWRFSPRSLKESLHLLRDDIEDCAKELRADFRANQLLLTKESGRYERLYKLNCETAWVHP